MNLDCVYQMLETYNDPRGRLSVLFVKKTATKYESFLPSISNEVQKEITGLFLDNILGKRNSDLEKIAFNPSGQENNQYSECSTDYVGNFEEVIHLFNNVNIEEEIEPDSVSFLIFRLRINHDNTEEKYLYFFRKNHKLKNIRQGFWMRKVSDTFNILDGNKLIGIDGGIDAISDGSMIFFFSHISAERIFNLREKFKENAKIVLAEIEKGEKITNFNRFRDDCLDDARILRRLTKIQTKPQIIELFHQHFYNAPEVVELFDLNITFNDDKTKIVYDDKEQLTHITMLMRDAYYRTVLAERMGVDDYNI